ncbi:MAG: hypothetical protein ACPF8V_01515, partial [Luteibaculum sp.]
LRQSEYVFLGEGFGEIEDRQFYQFENEEIRSLLSRLTTVKAGLEVRLNKLYLRGGINIQLSPFTNAGYGNMFTNRQTISGGLGYRFSNFTLDVFAANTQWEEGYLPVPNLDLQRAKLSEFSFGAGLSFFF